MAVVGSEALRSKETVMLTFSSAGEVRAGGLYTKECWQLAFAGQTTGVADNTGFIAYELRSAIAVSFSPTTK